MATLPTPNESNIITKAPLLSPEIGEIVAWHDEEGPSVDLRLKPEDTDQYAEASFSPRELRELADQLHEVAAVAQRAGWTPEVLAQARERYLPGMSDAQIIERLDRLSGRIGGLLLGPSRVLTWQAGRILVAEVALEALDEASSAVKAALDQFEGASGVMQALVEVERSFARLRGYYRAETEYEP